MNQGKGGRKQPNYRGHDYTSTGGTSDPIRFTDSRSRTKSEKERTALLIAIRVTSTRFFLQEGEKKKGENSRSTLLRSVNGPFSFLRKKNKGKKLVERRGDPIKTQRISRKGEKGCSRVRERRIG